jgi:flagellar biosynthetic protein FliR
MDGIVESIETGAWVGTFFWPFLRFSALFVSAPFFSSQLISIRIRVATALALTIFVMPFLPATPYIDPISVMGLLVALQQIIIGLSIGFFMQLIFGAVMIAGESMAMSMGLGFASMVDPQNGVNMPVVSQFFIVLATLIFILLNGPVLMIRVLIDSFETLPVGLNSLSGLDVKVIVDWGSQMFRYALMIAIPVVTALLLIYLALGVMTRAAPQLNIFSVGFPITLMGGFVMMTLLIPAFVPSFTKMLNDKLAYLDLKPIY